MGFVTKAQAFPFFTCSTAISIALRIVLLFASFGFPAITSLGHLISKIDNVFNRINEHNLACVQLHGEESPQYCRNIMDSGTKVIKSFRIDDDFDFSILKNYENNCDLFLFDSKSELPGWTGKSFNWENLKKYKLKKEFFISGGIGLHSIESLIELFKMDLPIYGVDVNSKFEDEKYLKKIDELKTFIETIKNEIYSR